jgi:hypothetical protein
MACAMEANSTCAMETNSADRRRSPRDEEDVTDLQLICMHTQFEFRI